MFIEADFNTYHRNGLSYYTRAAKELGFDSVAFVGSTDVPTLMGGVSEPSTHYAVFDASRIRMALDSRDPAVRALNQVCVEVGSSPTSVLGLTEKQHGSSFSPS